MPQEIRLWKVRDKNLERISRVKSLKQIPKEEYLEDLLEHDISIISDDLIVIGRQVETDFGKVIDLLCLNRDGDLVIVELKKGKAPRDVIAQVLEYASWVDDLSYEDIIEIANDYLKEKQTTLEEIYHKKFGSPLPDVLNESHQILIVASDLDAQAERVIKYLSQYGIRINAVTLNYFRAGDDEFIVGAMLVPKGEEERRKTKRRRYLTYDELMVIAEDNGVGELYSMLVEGLTPLFDYRGTTLSSIAFCGLQEGKMNTIFSLIPTQSSRESGLKFQVYLKRFARYFNMTEHDAEKILPLNKREWKYYRNAPPEYSGYEGFFKDRNEAKNS